MAAGQGFIEFSTGDVLTAAAANGYLASQVVMVFASSAARTSAITSPQEGMISYLKDTNAVEYYSGTAWAAVGGGGGTSLQVLTVNETQASGTQGGTFTSAAWRTRTLNTTVQNTITGASLASNQITLPAGTYYVMAIAPAYQVENHSARFYNITDSTVVMQGNNQFGGTTTVAQQGATVSVTFTISGSKTFELQHYSGQTKTTQGFGAAAGLGISEIYSSVTIIKVA